MVNKQKIKNFLIGLPGFYKTACTLAKRINPRILVYHRFCDQSDPAPYKIDGKTFKWQLNQIVKKFQIISLNEYIEFITENREIPENLVIITVDDGYFDFYQIAYPIIKDMNIKVTLFSTVNFIDKKIWMWPDRITYALEKTNRKQFVFSFEKKRFICDLSSIDSTLISWKAFSDYCIKVEDKKKWDLIGELEKYLDMDTPNIPLPEYSSVTWKQLAEMNAHGVEIGSHTINHPILSKISEEDLYQEVHLSKKILEEKLDCEVKTFCYPNSYPGDINDAVIEQVKAAGYKGAVFGGLPSSLTDLYTLPRIGVERDSNKFLWKFTGMEYVIPYLKKSIHYSK
ncbi:MAG: polysaccharide deacetylase family protein [Proteobacteria bacterium]|nr:polysaccharide deacetylase family protein [Pseudomonadota bacterium]